MSEKESSSSSGGIGLFGGLFLVLLTLKLLGKINVSWWVVTAPLWGGILLWMAFLALLLGVAIVAHAAKKR